MATEPSVLDKRLTASSKSWMDASLHCTRNDERAVPRLQWFISGQSELTTVCFTRLCVMRWRLF